MEISQTEMQREKNRIGIQNLWDNIKRWTQIIGIVQENEVEYL